jgi:hypothetical protein
MLRLIITFSYDKITHVRGCRTRCNSLGLMRIAYAEDILELGEDIREDFLL